MNIREQIDQFKNYNHLNLKYILNNSDEIRDIFDICKNETQMSEQEFVVAEYYTRIYECCVLELHGLTHKNVPIISEIRNNIQKTNNKLECFKQYKKITNPEHIVPALLLKMINDTKELHYESEEMKKWKPLDIIHHFIRSLLTDEPSYFSTSMKTKLLNGKIIVK